MSEVNIINIELPKGQYKNKCPYEMEPIGVTIHETDNNASARDEISYMQRNTNEVSFHFAVDEKEIIQGLPLNRNGWHAGDGGSGTGNRTTIAIEICRNYRTDDLTNYYMARKNAEKLVGYLIRKYGWTDKNIYTHNHWSGKNCPRVILKEGYFETFKANAMKYKNPEPTPTPAPKPTPKKKYITLTGRVDLYDDNSRKYPTPSGKTRKVEVIDETPGWYKVRSNDFTPTDVWIKKQGVPVVKPAPVKNKPSGAWKAENGTFILNQGVYERNDPDVSDKRGLRLLPSGTRVPYDAYQVSGGYVWLRNSVTGKVIPWRVHNGETWGKVV